MILYVETSVWNMLIDADSINEEKRKDTELLFEEGSQGKHELVASELVLAEIAADPNPIHKFKLEDALTRSRARALLSNDRIVELAHEYVRRKIVPSRYLDDAIHIAFAVHYGLDAIISWNMAHIVKVQTRRLVREYNEEHGLPVPDIATPSEVIDRGHDDEPPA